MIINIPRAIDNISEKMAKKTKPFVESRIGRIFLLLTLAGPMTFAPTIWQAWTAPNIDALRTLTWPLMLLVNTSASLSVIHNGDWRIRLVMILWTIMLTSIWIATIVR